jgi:hypothetical protein
MPPRKRWPSSPRRSEQRYAKHGSCANPPPPSSCPRRASAPNSPGSRLEGQFQPYRPLDGQVGGFAALWIQSTELAVRRKRSTRSPPRRRPAAFTTMPEDTHPGSLGVAVGTATTRGASRAAPAGVGNGSRAEGAYAAMLGLQTGSRRERPTRATDVQRS